MATFTIAEGLRFLPIIAHRGELHLRRNDQGKFAVGTGPREYNELLFRSGRFTRLKKYNANILGRDSIKNSFDSVRVLVF